MPQFKYVQYPVCSKITGQTPVVYVESLHEGKSLATTPLSVTFHIERMFLNQVRTSDDRVEKTVIVSDNSLIEFGGMNYNDFQMLISKIGYTQEMLFLLEFGNPPDERTKVHACAKWPYGAKKLQNSVFLQQINAEIQNPNTAKSSYTFRLPLNRIEIINDVCQMFASPIKPNPIIQPQMTHQGINNRSFISYDSMELREQTTAQAEGCQEREEVSKMAEVARIPPPDKGRSFDFDL